MRPRTHRTYEGYLRLYIKPRLGDIPLNKLTENDKQQICVWMKPDEYANGKGIADSQIRCCRSLCRQALEKAAEEHLILCNPAIGCKCPPAKREEMKIPSGETMQRVLIQAKEENYYELFPLEFATGLRLRELAALQWDDLNLTTGELRIDKQASIVGSEVPPPGKRHGREAGIRDAGGSGTGSAGLFRRHDGSRRLCL
ncbi:tyrosine-type recombinase/integrase [Flavonifractor plautii]|uniref:tyrosine-type recombinase/integrase n=1 Tax=Flavonifractor plautii TaxID=292800 RepID=UPI0036F28673